MTRIIPIILLPLTFSCSAIIDIDGPWNRHPIPEISKEEAQEIFLKYVVENGLDVYFYDSEPVILDNYYVFPDIILNTLPVGAFRAGIWVNIYTGNVGTYEEIKSHDNSVK
ncbi:MAG: hypothetical protein HQ510_03520 [Candidatus Marinimicrobia bacterium]|nr:hypothetical protein [Candidatus Neomarinimicrobiota bacterium]